MESHFFCKLDKNADRERENVTAHGVYMYVTLTSAGCFETEYVITVYCATATRNYCEELLLAKTPNKGSNEPHIEK